MGHNGFDDATRATVFRFLQEAQGLPTLDALNRGDLPILKAVTVLGAIALVIFNMLSDLLYAWADPRVRLS